VEIPLLIGTRFHPGIATTRIIFRMRMEGAGLKLILAGTVATGVLHLFFKAAIRLRVVPVSLVAEQRVKWSRVIFIAFSL